MPTPIIEKSATVSARKAARWACCCYLDRFKRLNDTFGHHTSGEALRLVGGCLKKLASELRFPARYGGEEFSMIVSSGRSGSPPTATIGAVHLQAGDPALNPKSVTKRADECLYEAKHGGRNRVVFSGTKRPAPPPDRKSPPEQEPPDAQQGPATEGTKSANNKREKSSPLLFVCLLCFFVAWILPFGEPVPSSPPG